MVIGIDVSKSVNISLGCKEYCLSRFSFIWVELGYVGDFGRRSG